MIYPRLTKYFYIMLLCIYEDGYYINISRYSFIFPRRKGNTRDTTDTHVILIPREVFVQRHVCHNPGYLVGIH